tara:strand:- start:1693 stop:1800 length:108 start_codon:yes stop_codon:yes gene_type:complete
MDKSFIKSNKKPYNFGKKQQKMEKIDFNNEIKKYY